MGNRGSWSTSLIALFRGVIKKISSVFVFCVAKSALDRVVVRNESLARLKKAMEVKQTVEEKRVERHLVESVKGLGGMCLKFVSPGTAGVPDRLIILPPGRIIFAELKTDTGKLSKIQERTIGEMIKRGADVRVLYGLKDVKDFIDGVKMHEV